MPRLAAPKHVALKLSYSLMTSTPGIRFTLKIKNTTCRHHYFNVQRMGLDPGINVSFFYMA
jgi:hypothetical protein